jgi:hypothetical protein
MEERYIDSPWSRTTVGDRASLILKNKEFVNWIQMLELGTRQEAGHWDMIYHKGRTEGERK